MTHRPTTGFNNVSTITNTMREIRSKTLATEIDLVASGNNIKAKSPALYEQIFGKRDPEILAHIEMMLG